MARKDSFLSHLFSSHPEDAPTEAVRQEDAVPEDAAPVPPEEAALPAPSQLALPAEHALNRLWRLRAEQGWTPAPWLSLDGRAAAGQEMERELGRLNVAVTAAANRRLAKAVPKEPDATRPDLDAMVLVFVPSDHMSAWVMVFPPTGQGKELDREMLSKALREHDIRCGVDEALLDGLPELTERYFHLYLAAQGTPPVHGKDGYVIDLYPRHIVKEVTVDEFDRVDYTSLNLVQNVEKGREICRIIPPVPGVPGRTVQDKPVPARDGVKASPPVGRNTELSEDGGRLLATVSGHVEFNGRGFQVKPVLEIGTDVDYSTGSINFLGDVHIHGDVHSGFTVRAVGSITVDGVVEACTIEAGGDLVVAKGVQGNNQAVIRAHHNIYAKYLENSKVYARENLQSECIINCDVYSDGAVQVRTGRGTIIGGMTRAAQEISANTIGSRSECLTVVALGGMPCEEFERKVLIQEIEELEAEMERVERQPDSPAKLSRLSQARMHLSINRLKLNQFEKDLQKLQESLEEQSGQRLTCSVAYPGTEIRIGDSVLRLDRESRHCTAVELDGKIHLMQS